MSRLTIGVVVMGLAVTGCGGGGSSGGSTMQNLQMPPPGSYDLQKAMVALEASGSSTPVNLSGTAMSGGTSYPFTGTGTLTLASGTSGTFNGGAATLQTMTITGTITVAGKSTAYDSSVVNAYEGATGAILGESESSEFDVASAPIMIPSSVGTTPMILGTLSRYTDGTLSVALGTTQISVAVQLIPVDPGTREVVEFTFKSYDMSGSPVETDTQSYYLSENSAMSFYGATASNASGSLSVTLQ